jgi:hypothetical protein
MSTAIPNAIRKIIKRFKCLYNAIEVIFLISMKNIIHPKHGDGGSVRNFVQNYSLTVITPQRMLCIEVLLIVSEKIIEIIEN